MSVKNVKLLGGLLALVLLFFATPIVAAPYGSGPYGDDVYQAGDAGTGSESGASSNNGGTTGVDDGSDSSPTNPDTSLGDEADSSPEVDKPEQSSKLIITTGQRVLSYILVLLLLVGLGMYFRGYVAGRQKRN